MKLKGKSVVVTGASSGMGKAIVERFAKEGANIIAVARRKERLEALAESLKDEPGKVIPYVGDISKEETNVGAIDAAVKHFGRLDILINNAGVMDDMSPIGDVRNETIDHVFSVNLYAPIYAMRKAVQVFLEQGDGGNIVSIASLGGLRTVAGAVYSASKAAVISLTRNTAFMYMNEGIRCNAIAPGGIKSEIASSMGIPNPKGYDRVKKVLGAAPPPGETEQIASAALFLASDESSYISGDVLMVDGGWAAG